MAAAKAGSTSLQELSAMRLIVLAVVVVLSGCGLSGSVPEASRPLARQAVLSCPQSPAKEVFGEHALCVCGDLRAVGDGVVVTGGVAGINGQLDVVGAHDYRGDVLAYGGISGVGDLRVEGSLSTAGQVNSTGSLEVAGDLTATSGVCGTGELTVKGTLRGANEWTGPVSTGAVGEAMAVGAPPCACGAGALDVSARVAQARASNDNGRAGLGRQERVGDHAARLGSGSYWFDGVSTVGDEELLIDGAVALFVAGDFEAVGRTHVTLTPGSTLDLFIDGDLSMVGDASFGAGATAGSLRVYVAGERALSFVGTQGFVGSLHAPGSTLELVGDSRFEGALFVGSVEGVGRLEVNAGPQTVAGPDDALCRPEPVVTLN